MAGIAKLRGHHLICLQFFSGKGYNREFVDNLKSVLENAGKKGVEIISGADDICMSCPHLRNGKCSSDEQSDEEIAGMDRSALELLGKTAGMNTGWNSIREKIPAIFPLWHERYCKRCVWANACEDNYYYLRMRDGKDPV